MTAFTVTPIREMVRVHTGMSKSVKRKIQAIAEKTGTTQEVVINSLLTKALAKKRK